METISDAEWSVMRVVWNQEEPTARNIIDILLEASDWKEGTIKTLIHRLVKKGYLEQVGSKPYTYKATISEDDANAKKILSELEAICNAEHGQVLHLVLDHEIKKGHISKQEIKQLIDLLESNYENTPGEVICNCHEGTCACSKH